MIKVNEQTRKSHILYHLQRNDVFHLTRRCLIIEVDYKVFANTTRHGYASHLEDLTKKSIYYRFTVKKK